VVSSFDGVSAVVAVISRLVTGTMQRDKELRTWAP
jgi:hypothetical protein